MRYIKGEIPETKTKWSVLVNTDGSIEIQATFRCDECDKDHEMFSADAATVADAIAGHNNYMKVFEGIRDALKKLTS